MTCTCLPATVSGRSVDATSVPHHGTFGAVVARAIAGVAQMTVIANEGMRLAVIGPFDDAAAFEKLL